MNSNPINSFITILILASFSAAPKSLAQVVPDNTVGTQVINNVDINKVPSTIIDGGSIKGSNLFHSLSEFNVNAGQGVYFINPYGVTNILTRVTGANISNIDGTLGVLGNANLFLLNPNGITFGTNARLEMGGSFFATTANSIHFADGTKFDTTDKISNPILTISVPIGLNFNSNGIIKVNGTGNTLTNQGLSVAPGKTLALVGGNINLDGGLITVPSGRIEIGSVENGSVSVNSDSWNFGYNSVEKFGNIELLNRANITNISSNSQPNGAIKVQGRNITLDKGSQIISLTPGTQAGVNIDVKATQSLNIGGSDNVQPITSRITSIVSAGAEGIGGNISVTTPQIKITDGGRIETTSSARGKAGNINIDSGIINISGFSLYQDKTSLTQPLNSAIDSANLGTGAGGNVNVSSQKIILLHGGLIGTFSGLSATGTGGDVNVNAIESIISQGTNLLNPIFSSGISAVSFGTGAGGNIRVSTKQLDLQQGGSVQSSTYGSGKGGNIDVNSELIYGTGDNPSLKGISSGISASTYGSGHGGDVRIATDTLQLFDGADINSFSSNQPLGGILLPGSGTGNGGNITVTAKTVEIIGMSELAPDTGGGLLSVSFGSGRSGDIKVSTQRLTVKDGGSLSTNVLVGALSLGVPAPGAGKGEAGNLFIDANEIEVSGTNKLIFTPSYIGTASSSDSKGGDTVINTRQLIIQDGAKVGSTTAATGAAGAVTVNADTIRVSGVRPDGTPSEISSNAPISSDAIRYFYFLPPVPSGNTGQVNINAERVVVDNGARISVQNDGTGNAGKLGIAANTLKLDNGTIQATSNSGEGGDIILQGKLLQIQKNSAITATAKNQGNGGNITIDAQAVVQSQNSDIIAQAFNGRGGNIQINTQGLLGGQFRSNLTLQSDITASSLFGVNGIVYLNAPQADITPGLNTFTLSFLDNNTQITNTCRTVNKNRFTISGKGGLPASPIQSLKGETIWQDFRNADNLNSYPRPTRASEVNNNIDVDVVEAQAWVIDNKGEVELVTDKRVPTLQHNWYSAPNCR